MEHALLFLPYLLITSLLLLIFSLWYLHKRVTRSKPNLPPGPWTLPFVGCLHHLVNAGLPHHALRDLAHLHGPIMLLRAGEIDVVVISSREVAKEVMKTHDANLANRPAISAGNVLLYACKDIAFSNGSRWRQLRQICNTEFLSSQRVKSFSSTRQAVINSLLKTCSLVADNSPVDVSAMMSELTNNIVIRTAFGVKCKNRRVILEIMREVLDCLSGFDLYELFPSLSWLNVNMRRRLARLSSKMDSVMEEILQEHLQKREHRKKGHELEYNLVDALINVKEHDDSEESITMDNIKAVILDLFLAGTDSSATTLTWAMSELVKNPEAMKKLQAEIRHAARENTKFDVNSLSYLKLVLKETLRMHPAGPLLLPRQCMTSCEILGYTIPTGARLVVNAWAIGRNPDYWNDLEEFKPERFETSSIEFNGQNFEYLPFGAGRRICAGLEFAVALVQEALASFLLHFDWKLPNGMKLEDLDMTETFGVVAAKKEPLYLIPTLRVGFPDVG